MSGAKARTYDIQHGGLTLLQLRHAVILGKRAKIKGVQKLHTRT